MKSRMMSLKGHLASPVCKYTPCRSPCEWDLFATYKSIDRYLTENTETLSRDTDVKNIKNFAFDTKYHFFREIKGVYKKNIENKEYFMIDTLAYRGEPVVVVHVLGPKMKTINDILKELSANNVYIFDFDRKNYSGWEKHPQKEMGFKNIPELKNKVSQDIIDNVYVKHEAH